MVNQSLSRWMVATFFAVFLLLGLLTAADYGVPWDENDEMDILRMNLWEYARAFDMEEAAFERRAAQFDEELTISALAPISESIEQDHGISAFYPMAGVVMSEKITEAQRSTLWHMWCWVVFTLGAFALYAVLRHLQLERLPALLGPLLLLLTPQFFAHGHFNNKDIALFALALCVLWQALRLMERPTFPRGLLFACAGAFAANTKLAGLAVWGLCALFVLICQLVKRNMRPRVWAVAGVTLASFFGIYALITPALWADPAAFLEYGVINALSFQRWENVMLFRGAVFSLDRQSLPFYYLPYMILATTPIWLIVVIAQGAVRAIPAALRRRAWADEGMKYLLVLLLFALPIAVAVLTRTHVYNGWRHFYFVYGPMLVLAAWGADRLMRALKKKWARRACAALLAVCMLLTGAGIVAEHPYQYAYYQPVVQLRGTDFNELDYWNISVRNALVQLAQEQEGEIVIMAGDIMAGYGLKKSLYAMDDGLSSRFRRVEKAEEAQYVLVNPTYATFSEFKRTDDLQERVTLTAYGQPIMRIYERMPKGDTL